MNDREIIQRIHDLVAEEDKLHADGVNTTLDEPSRERLRDIEEGLDQCWDLLRQRRAKREFGEDPDRAQARAVPTVEGYQQ